MSRSFGLVEEKLRETKFFLDLFKGSRFLSCESRYYFSAFATAARSVTFCLQASLDGVDGFSSWYETIRGRLKDDLLSRFFVDTRNSIQKTGENPLSRSRNMLEALSFSFKKKHFLDVPDLHGDVPTGLTDAVHASECYFSSLVELVFDCYEKFVCVVDPRWYFTEAHFAKMGRGLADASAELGLPPAWESALEAAHLQRADGWKILRSQQELCPINDLFEQYLAKRIPDPDDECPA